MRLQPELADDLAALAQRMDVAVDVLDGAEIGLGDGHQMKVDRQEMLADDVQPRGRQQMVDVGDTARDGVLDRDHGEARRALVHSGESVLEGGTWQHLPVGTRLQAGRVGIGAELALERNDLAHDVLLAHRADPEGRVSEKWSRFYALNDALFKEGASDRSQKWKPLLGPMPLPR